MHQSLEIARDVINLQHVAPDFHPFSDVFINSQGPMRARVLLRRIRKLMHRTDTVIGKDINGEDNQNVIFWVKETAPGGAVLVNNERTEISGALAVTFPTYFDDHTIVEADIVFNGVNHRWFTDYSNTFSKDNFVEAVALHEFGHFIGLQHSPLGAATMFSRTAAGVSVSAGLTLDEAAAAQSLYGRDSESDSFGAISGKVTMSGKGVFGAVIIAEDEHGNIVQSTVTESSGDYDIAPIPPGKYRMRVSP